MNNVTWPFDDPPRKVQQEALNRGYGRPGFGYFMRMRMGKSAVALAEYKLNLLSEKTKWLFVVTRNSLKEQWRDECEKWGINVYSHLYSTRHMQQTIKWLGNMRYGIVVLNYEGAKKLFEALEEIDFDLSEVMLVLDESTEIKNPQAVRTKAIMKFARNVLNSDGFVRVLSGKPKANNNGDLWTQLKVIGAIHTNYYGFRHTFCKMGGFEGRQIIGDLNNDALQKIMNNHSFIAGDEYLADFPPKVYMPLRKVFMAPDQHRMYQEMERDFIAELEDEQTTAEIALTKYLRLRQITSGFYSTDDNEIRDIMPPHDNPRVQEVEQIMEEMTGKTIVVTTFKRSVDHLLTALHKYNPVAIIGGMSGDEIEEAKREFNNNPDCRVLIGNIQTLQFGHTLCATDDDPADTIIFYENNFSLIARAQAEARPEKMGRNVPVAVFDLYSSKIDKMMIDALRRKEDAALALMNYAREYGVLHAA